VGEGEEESLISLLSTTATTTTATAATATAATATATTTVTQTPPTAAATAAAVPGITVSAKIKVTVDLNLPVRSDLSMAMSFLPVKLLLGQAGGLTTKTFMSTLAPTFASLLLIDYEKRRLTL
jgi:hypothetical protein